MRPYRKFLPALLLLLLPACGFKGCTALTQQQTDVEILQVASIALSTGFAAAGDTADATKYQALMATLITDAQNFVPGSPTQDVQQASTDVLNFLSGIDPNSKLTSEIAIVVNGVLAILSDIPGASAPVAAPGVQAHVAMVSHGKPAPRTVKDFKAQWNSALAANPVPGLQPLK